MIEHFAEVPDGDVYVANGLGPVLRWDGFSAEFEEVGMDPPGTAIVLSASVLAGAIVGTYYAYERFVDDRGFVSDLSPISNEVVASGTTGSITAATNASPIVITSTAHGLSTGDVVKIEGVGGNTSANNTWVVTVLTANTFSLDESHGTADYTGSGTWTSGVSSLTYSSVAVPTEAKVARRQILRNTDGQTTTFYVDVDTTDLIATSFVTTRGDQSLLTQEAVPILDIELRPFANRHAKPLTFFPFLAHHLDRMFLLGNIEYNVGNVKVTNGSTTVYGVGTEWTTSLDDRFLYVTGATQVYEIASVDTTAQTLTLTEAYTDTSDKFAFYSIKPPRAYRRIVQYSEPGLPQSWPAINGLEVQDTGDDFTGIMSKGPFIFFLESRHIHKLTFAAAPEIDGAIFMVANRGCINNRCWVLADDAAFMLDELGVHKFSGNSQVESLSQQIQSVFRPRSDSDVKINWKQKEFFHASHDKQQEVIRWHVCLDGSVYPKQALCYHYRVNRWWIEGYPVFIGGSCAGELAGIPQVYFAAEHAKVLASWIGTLDYADPSLGDVRSLCTSATQFTLTDSDAAFHSSAIGTKVSIVSGTGKGQTRRVIEVASTELTVNAPWLTIPDETSVYQIGGVHYYYRSPWLRFAKAEENAPRCFELIFEEMEEDAVTDLRFSLDKQGNYDTQMTTHNFASGGGLSSTKGEQDLQVDLTHENGIVRHVTPGHREHHSAGRRYTQFELEGFSNEESIRFYQWLYEGCAPLSGEE